MAIKVMAIIPDEINIKSIRRELEKELLAEGKDLSKDYRKTSSTWEGEKPKYPIEKGNEPSILVAPNGSEMAVNKWKWNNFGTSPHSIRPRRKLLRFRIGGRAKTRAGKLQSGPGRKASGPTVFALRVHHPGTKARGWLDIIFNNSLPRFQKRIDKAIGKGVKLLY